MMIALAKAIVRKIRAARRAAWRFLIAEQTLGHLQAIREHEIEVVLGILPLEGKLLEIGSGTGWQAQMLSSRGFEVSAIDLPSSNYYENRIYPVKDYDGRTLPFEDGAFDIVYSSNLLEHIPHVHDFQREIHRVLKPEGCVIHVLPSSSWRFWTNITHALKYLTLPGAHGEQAANAIVEIYQFSRRTWRSLFRETGWIVSSQCTNGLFYTGCSILDSRLSIKKRRYLSWLLGSSCNIFVLRKSTPN